MQPWRFEEQDIFVLEKSVELSGKHIAKSKKLVKWVLRHGKEVHYVNMSASFLSGKKKAQHNGYTISDLVDDHPAFQVVLYLGKEKVIFTLDQKTEELLVQRRYLSHTHAFDNFDNVFSQDITKAYERHFG